MHLGVQRDALDGTVPAQFGRTAAGGRRIAGALRGKRPTLSQYAAKPPREALAQLGPAFQAKELDFTSFAGDPVYLATGAHGETRIIPMQGEPLRLVQSGANSQLVAAATSPASVAEARLITRYDTYYLDRHRRAAFAGSVRAIER